MGEGCTITISKPLQLGLTMPDYKKWDVLDLVDGSQQVIIIRIKGVGVGLNHLVQYTVQHQPKFKKKWKFKLWFKWLKLKVWIGDLYKT